MSANPEASWPPDFRQLATRPVMPNGTRRRHRAKPLAKLIVVICADPDGRGHACFHLPYLVSKVPESVDVTRYDRPEDNELFDQLAPYAIDLPGGTQIPLVLAIARIPGISEATANENELHLDLWATHSLSDVVEEVLDLIFLATGTKEPDYEFEYRTSASESPAPEDSSPTMDTDPTAGSADTGDPT